MIRYRLYATLALTMVLCGCSTWYGYNGVKYSTASEALQAQKSDSDRVLPHILVKDKPIIDAQLDAVMIGQSQAEQGVRIDPKYRNAAPEIVRYIAETKWRDWELVVNAIERSNTFSSVARIDSSHNVDLYYFPESKNWTLSYLLTGPNSAVIHLINPTGQRENLYFRSELPGGAPRINNLISQAISAVQKGEGTASGYFANESEPPLVPDLMLSEIPSSPKLSIDSQALGDNSPPSQYTLGGETRQVARQGPTFVGDNRSPYQGPSFKPNLKSGAEWLVSVKSDPITDLKRVTAKLEPNEASTSSRDTSLIIRCTPEDLDIYVNFNDYLGDSVSVISRVDKAQPNRMRWNISNDNTSAFYPKDTRILLRRLLQAERFVARTTPYNESTVTLVFEIGGLYNALAEYADVCFRGVVSNSEVGRNPARKTSAQSASKAKKVASKHDGNGLFSSKDPQKEPFSVPLSKIESRINNDPSADGIVMKIVAANKDLALDIVEFPGDTKLVAMMRVVMMTARLAEQDYSRMVFVRNGESVFYIDGKPIRDIGRQFVWGEKGRGQNAIHLLRLFVDNLRNADGSRVVPPMRGALLADTNSAMTALNQQFHRNWTIR